MRYASNRQWGAWVLCRWNPFLRSLTTISAIPTPLQLHGVENPNSVFLLRRILVFFAPSLRPSLSLFSSTPISSGRIRVSATSSLWAHFLAKTHLKSSLFFLKLKGGLIFSFSFCCFVSLWLVGFFYFLILILCLNFPRVLVDAYRLANRQAFNLGKFDFRESVYQYIAVSFLLV